MFCVLVLSDLTTITTSVPLGRIRSSKEIDGSDAKQQAEGKPRIHTPWSPCPCRHRWTDAQRHRSNLLLQRPPRSNRSQERMKLPRRLPFPRTPLTALVLRSALALRSAPLLLLPNLPPSRLRPEAKRQRQQRSPTPPAVMRRRPWRWRLPPLRSLRRTRTAPSRNSAGSACRSLPRRSSRSSRGVRLPS